MNLSLYFWYESVRPKTKLDEMQRDAEAEIPIKSPFRAWRGESKNISAETFMDNCVIYTALVKK